MIAYPFLGSAEPRSHLNTPENNWRKPAQPGNNRPSSIPSVGFQTETCLTASLIGQTGDPFGATSQGPAPREFLHRRSHHPLLGNSATVEVGILRVTHCHSVDFFNARVFRKIQSMPQRLSHDYVSLICSNPSGVV